MLGLANAPLSYDAKLPLLLNKSSQIAGGFIRYLRLMNCHAGPKTLGSLLCELLEWKPRLLTQIIGNLPANLPSLW